MYLKTIFESITPENIKNIPLLKTAMDIFIENLEENSQISSDIKKIYDNISKETDSDIIKECKDNLRKGLLNVYLSSFYNVISKAQNNEVVKAKITSINNTSPLTTDVIKILNDEHFITNKSFKEKVGTEIGIKYSYNLTNYLESSTLSNDMQFHPEKPFHFRTEGSIYKEMYENIVKPLSHPLGFTYTYNQIVKDSISDFFGIEFTYNVYDIELRNIDGRFDVFTKSIDDDAVKQDFLNRINPITGLLFTETEYYQQVTVYTQKYVKTFNDTFIEGRHFKSILFTDGTYLQQYTNPIEIMYVYYSDFISGSLNYIKDFTGHWSLYVTYESDFTFNYSDDITHIFNEFEITKIKEDNNGDEDQKYYNLTSGIYAFNIGGNEYEYAPGLHETQSTYNDYNLINDEINDKFTVNVFGNTTLNENVNIELSDKYGFKIKKLNIIPDGIGNFSTSFNTYQLSGDIYTLNVSTLQSGITYNYSLTTDGLNNFNRNLYFTEVKDNNHIINNTLRAKGVGPAGETVHLLLTDSLGSTTTASGVIDINNEWDIILSLALKEPGYYRIDAIIYALNNKPLYTTFFEGLDLRTPIEDIKITVNVFEYENTAPNFSELLSSSELSNIYDMPGFNSTSVIIKKQIGELAIDDTYANEDTSILTYMLNNNINDINLLPEELMTKGSYIEGSNYDLVFSTNLELEETFINYGRKIYPIDTSDFIILTSTDYCSDVTTIFNLSTSGYYLFTDESIGIIDYYFFSTDDFYLTTLGDTI